MKPIWHLGLVLCLLASTKTAAAANYTVKRGDTLASIARSYYGEPVFGPKGTINKIYKMNAWAKANSTLEPGQMIVLEDKAATHERAALSEAAMAPIAAAKPSEPLTEAMPTPPVQKPSVAEPVASTVDHPAVAPTIAPVTVSSEAADKPPVAKPNVPIEESGDEYEDAGPQPHGYFSIIPSYSLIKQSATEIASGTSYTVSSNPAASIELGWDHWWNESFSTVLTYSVMQVSSKETSDATGSKVIDSMILSKAELALMNRVWTHLRMGLGVAYGDHLFLENFVNAPVDPSIYKIAFMNPFAAAEWTAFENRRFEFAVNLKIGALPAQVGHGHDLTSGTEYMGQLSLLQKFEKWALLYGFSYSQEDQTRTDANETRTEYAFKIGALF